MKTFVVRVSPGTVKGEYEEQSNRFRKLWVYLRVQRKSFSPAPVELPEQTFPDLNFPDKLETQRTVFILIFAFASWCVITSRTQTALTSFLPTYSAISQHSFSPPETSFGGPTAYTVTGFPSPTKYYGSFKRSYVRPKVFTVLSHKYAIPTSGYDISNLDHFQKHHHAPAQYEFQYKVHDPHYGAEFGHAETRHGDIAKGQYMVLLPDGRRQIVDYVADSHGYRPTIRYESGHERIGYGR